MAKLPASNRSQVGEGVKLPEQQAHIFARYDTHLPSATEFNELLGEHRIRQHG